MASLHPDKVGNCAADTTIVYYWCMFSFQKDGPENKNFLIMRLQL